MNFFQAIGSLFSGVYQTALRGQEEREQQGPEGRAYDDALKRSGQAYYQKHGTYDGWSFDDKTLTGNE